MENWKERFRNQFVDTYGEKDSKEWRIVFSQLTRIDIIYLPNLKKKE